MLNIIKDKTCIIMSNNCQKHPRNLRSTMKSNEMKIKELEQLLSAEPFNWNRFLELDRDLHVISSNICFFSFRWIASKYPPQNIVNELMNRYHRYITSNESITKECLVAGIEYDNVDVITFIAYHKGKQIFSQPVDKSLDLPLHRARSIDTASILIKTFPDAVRIRNRNGELPLHSAIKHFRSLNHIKLLIREGKRQHIDSGHGGILAKNIRGETPFSILCHQLATGIDLPLTFPLFHSDLRLWEVLTTLLQAYSTDDNGVIPHRHFRVLHSVISSHCPFQAVYLGQMLAPGQITEADENGRYPLSLAASHNSCPKQVLISLLGAYPNAINSVDRRGRLPLHWAAASGRNLEEGTKELFDANPSAISLSDNDGMWPFMLAASSYRSSLNTIYHLLSPEWFRD